MTDTHEQRQELGTEIAILDPAGLPEVFGSRYTVDAMLARVLEAAQARVPENPDMSRAKDRDAIRSAARFIASSKVALDEAGKTLNTAKRAEIDAVDAERRRIRAFLDAKRDEVRAPLDQWEDAEEERIVGLKRRLAELEPWMGSGGHSPSAEIALELARIETIPLDETWQEFLAEAGQRKDAAMGDLRAALVNARQQEADRAELARFRAEEEARFEANRLAEIRAQEERDRAAREKAEQERTARIEREKADAAIRAAAQARSQAEVEAAEKLKASEREAAAKIEAAERATREAEAARARAVEDERARVAERKRADALAQAKREENKRLKAKVHKEITAAIIPILGKDGGLAGPVVAALIADALMRGDIPRTRVTL